MDHHRLDDHATTSIHHDGSQIQSTDHQSDDGKSYHHESLAAADIQSMESQTSNSATNLGNPTMAAMDHDPNQVQSDKEQCCISQECLRQPDGQAPVDNKSNVQMEIDANPSLILGQTATIVDAENSSNSIFNIGNDMDVDEHKMFSDDNHYESNSNDPADNNHSGDGLHVKSAAPGQLIDVPKGPNDIVETGQLQVSRHPSKNEKSVTDCTLNAEDSDIRSDICIDKDKEHESDEQYQPLIVKDDSQQLKADMETYHKQDHTLAMTIHSSLPKDQSELDELPSSSDTSDDDDSDSSLSNCGDIDEIGYDKLSSGPIVEGELTLENLPEVEEVNFKLDESIDMENVGLISSVIDTLVIVKANLLAPALDIDSLLFLKDRSCIGKIFETFGPVNSPYYSIRFNSKTTIERMALAPSTVVYCAPSITDYTGYILVEQLRGVRGSDASWKNDIEPPPDHVEFSDDEEERQQKARLKNNNQPQKEKRPKNKRRNNKRQQNRQNPFNQAGFNTRHLPNNSGLYGIKPRQNPWNNPGYRSDKSDFIPTAFNVNPRYQMPVQFNYNNMNPYQYGGVPTNFNYQRSMYSPANIATPSSNQGQSQADYAYNEQLGSLVPQYSGQYEEYRPQSSDGTLSYNQPRLPGRKPNHDYQ